MATILNENGRMKNVNEDAGQLSAVSEFDAGHGIGWAVKQMQGGARVRRTGWNGKGMFVFLIREWTYTDGRQDNYPDLSFVAMKTAQDTVVPWLCSQADLLATDWELATLD